MGGCDEESSAARARRVLLLHETQGPRAHIGANVRPCCRARASETTKTVVVTGASRGIGRI